MMPAASPLLPAALAAPFALLPRSMHSRLLAEALNRSLAAVLRAGALDFLSGRVMLIEVRDAGVSWCLTLNKGRLQAVTGDQVPDLTIVATAYDFLDLVAGQVDPDTLVFQRRLVMLGDTELGLRVKNCLDSLDTDAIAMYRPLMSLLEKLLPVYRRLFA